MPASAWHPRLEAHPPGSSTPWGAGTTAHHVPCWMCPAGRPPHHSGLWCIVGDTRLRAQGGGSRGHARTRVGREQYCGHAATHRDKDLSVVSAAGRGFPNLRGGWWECGHPLPLSAWASVSIHMNAAPSVHQAVPGYLCLARHLSASAWQVPLPSKPACPYGPRGAFTLDLLFAQ